MFSSATHWINFSQLSWAWAKRFSFFIKTSDKSEKSDKKKYALKVGGVTEIYGFQMIVAVVKMLGTFLAFYVLRHYRWFNTDWQSVLQIDGNRTEIPLRDLNYDFGNNADGDELENMLDQAILQLSTVFIISMIVQEDFKYQFTFNLSNLFFILMRLSV